MRTLKGRIALFLVLHIYLFNLFALADSYDTKPTAKPYTFSAHPAREVTRAYAEVEVIPDENFSLEDALALETAPGGEAEILDDGRRVKLQIASEQVEALAERGVQMAVRRNFILAEKYASDDCASGNEIAPMATCTGDYRTGSNYTDVWIPDNYCYLSTYSDIIISGAPGGAVATCIDVSYSLNHSWCYDLVILVSDYSVDYLYELQNGESVCGKLVTGITGWGSEPVNQTWTLWAADCASGDIGYIDYWWIKVYYQSSGGYCGAEGGCNDDIDGMLNIDSVIVGDISNTGTGCQGGYSDYTYLSTEMTIGQDYPITVTNSNPFTDFGTTKCGVWVDWNQDLDFDDTGEDFTLTGNAETTTFTGTITVPGGASLGDTTMRVRMMWTETGETPQPCGTRSYGEVEDYTVTVVPAGVTISGHIETGGSSGIEGVLVSASTGETDTTSASGYYELELDYDWSGSITPTKTGWTFSPTERNYSNVTSDITNADFTGTPLPAPVVSGYIKTEGDDGIEGVEVTGTNGMGSTFTDGDGYYELTAPGNPWSGTITPIKQHWGFIPAYIDYVNLGSDATNQNYTGTYTADPTPTISGYVKTADGYGIGNVEVWADDLAGRSILTDANGYYEMMIPSFPLPVPQPWDVNITPHKTDWIFDPESTLYLNLSNDISDQNYTGTYVGGGCDAGWIEEWVARYHSDEKHYYTDEVQPHGLVVDKDGNVYVLGRAYSKLNGIYSWNWSMVMYDKSGQIVWQAQYDGPASQGDVPEEIIVDDDGNIYVTGYVMNELTEADIVILKYTTDSNEPNWIATYPDFGLYHDSPEGLTLDDEGNIYVTGRYHSSHLDSDIITIKYDPNGTRLWDTAYNGPANDDDEAIFVHVDDSGYVYVTGGSLGDVTDYDWVTIKYDPNGEEEWVKRYNGPADGEDTIGALALDSNGDIYVAGSIETSSSGYDFLLIKYDPNGNEIWKAQYNGPDNLNDGGGGVLIDEDDNIYVNGVANYTGILESSDLLLLKFRPDSNEPKWVAIYEDPELLLSWLAGMDMDPWGNIYIAGLGSFIIPGSDPVTGQGDYLAVKYSPDSNEPVWAARYEGGRPILDWPKDIAVDDYGNVYVTGYNDAFVTVKYSQCYIPGDCYRDYVIDTNDLQMFSNEWLRKELIADFTTEGGDGIINFTDWAAFARAWQSTAEPPSPNWDAQCDISPEGGDGIIDEEDASVFVTEWLHYSPQCADIAPIGDPDGIVNALDYAVFANHWLDEIDELCR